MLGDCIASLPFLTYLEKIYPNSYKMVYIDKKCAHITPFLLNHPLIDKIYISDEIDKVSEKDEAYFRQFHMVFEPFAPVYLQDWFNTIHITEMTFRMNLLRGQGFIYPKEYDLLTEEEKCPRLEQWFDAPKFPAKTVAIWPFAGYGNNDPTIELRSPNEHWWKHMVEELVDAGYFVSQYGHPLSPVIGDGHYLTDRRELSLFDAIKETLRCDLSITTDSGSSWLLNAYGAKNITLYTNYKENHTTNVDAYVPKNFKNNLISIWGNGNINNISHEEVINNVKSIQGI